MVGQARASLIRKRTSVNKVYVPAANRENQFLLVELELTDDKINQLLALNAANPLLLSQFYMDFKQAFFTSCKVNKIANAMFVANDKLVRVRFGEESQIIETNEQLFLFYDPEKHRGYRSFYDNEKLVSKIVMVVLATGDDIRQQAVELHSATVQMVADLAEMLSISLSQFKIRDHQHITYDLFSAYKGLKQTVTHEFRAIAHRYQQQSLVIPNSTNNSAYVVASIPIPLELVNLFEPNATHTAPYLAMYKWLANIVEGLLFANDISKFAMIANGRQPVVRVGAESLVENKGELVYVTFSNKQQQEVINKWNSTKLIDTFFVVIPTQSKEMAATRHGKFVNHCHDILTKLAENLELEKSREQIMVRFHQNIHYNCPSHGEND